MERIYSTRSADLRGLPLPLEFRPSPQVLCEEAYLFHKIGPGSTFDCCAGIDFHRRICDFPTSGNSTTQFGEIHF